MRDTMYSGDQGLAEMKFEEGDYGYAKCQFQACLDKVKQYEPKNKQKIKYLKDKVEECIRMQ